MRVLVVGGGGREHSLCRALDASPSVEALFAAPGNPGIEELATLVSLQPTDPDDLVAFAEAERIDLTVIGPEGPLVAGLVDRLEARGLRAFGPSAAAARIEGSKSWARRLCRDHGIPSPAHAEFDAMDDVVRYLSRREGPFVVKADGLAAGKGVTVTDDPGEALRAAEDCLVREVFGEAGRRLVIEECLVGVEVSALALVDGMTVVPLPLARDFKRIFEGDSGPNTGGMGAFSPLPFVDEGLAGEIEGILRATARALRDEGIPYRGVLYAGLMLTAEGPKVLEFNCRFGDPETQVILPRLRSDLGEVLMSCARGSLDDRDLQWSDRACVTVVAASAGYPAATRTGQPIDGLPEASSMEDVMVFHAGTARREGRVVTAGGRVLAVTALGSNLEQARDRAYGAVEEISFEGMQVRRDIAAGIPQGVAG